MIFNVISSSKGGGAELLVRELHRRYQCRGFNARTIYLTGNSEDLDKNEQIIGASPRNPVNILHIRNLLKSSLASCESELKVHVHLTWPFFYVALASIGLKNLKLVYTEHSTLNKRRKIPLWRYFERFVYARYSKIICISPGVYQSLAPWVGLSLQNRLVTVPNGSRIYSMASRPTLMQRKPRLISVGSLTVMKNFSTALGAVAEIKDEIESYTIIGEGPERTRLEKLIREYGLQDIVVLAGWSDSIDRYLQYSDIQVIPSLWEGFGLVAVEGMSTGIVVVSSNVDGLRDVLGPNNPAVTFVDRIEDKHAWSHGLLEAIRKLRAEDVSELALAARNQAEKFTLDAMADRYLGVYSSL